MLQSIDERESKYMAFCRLTIAPSCVSSALIYFELPRSNLPYCHIGLHGRNHNDLVLYGSNVSLILVFGNSFMNKCMSSTQPHIYIQKLVVWRRRSRRRGGDRSHWSCLESQTSLKIGVFCT